MEPGDVCEDDCFADCSGTAAQGRSGRPAAASDAELSRRIFVGNVSHNLTQRDVVNFLAVAGCVVSAYFPPNPHAAPCAGAHRGFGFVSFSDAEAADAAVRRLNGVVLAGRPVTVSHARQASSPAEMAAPATPPEDYAPPPALQPRIWVGGVDGTVSDADLLYIFEPWGCRSAHLVRSADSRTKCYGFASFGTLAEAADAIRHMHGVRIGCNMQLRCNWAVPMRDRDAGPTRASSTPPLVHGQSPRPRLLVRGLCDTVGDADLFRLFHADAAVGAHVLREGPTRASRGVGFVEFADGTDIMSAARRWHGRSFLGRIIRCQVADQQPETRR